MSFQFIKYMIYQIQKFCQEDQPHINFLIVYPSAPYIR